MILVSFNKYQDFVVYRFKKDLEDTTDIEITVRNDGRDEVESRGFYTMQDYRNCFCHVAAHGEEL